MDAPIRAVLAPEERAGCRFEECLETHYSAGWCKLHYYRNYSGRPLDGPRGKNPRVPGVTTIVIGSGYVHLFMPEHPNASGAGFIAQHRYVLEQHLGRYLLKGESVHHMNGDRADNRLENLELWVSTQPSGQRVEDRVADARRLLALYGDTSERRKYRDT